MDSSCFRMLCSKKAQKNAEPRAWPRCQVSWVLLEAQWRQCLAVSHTNLVGHELTSFLYKVCPQVLTCFALDEEEHNPLYPPSSLLESLDDVNLQGGQANDQDSSSCLCMLLP